MRWLWLLALAACAPKDRIAADALAAALEADRDAWYVVDVRSDREWQGPNGHIGGAVHSAWPRITHEAARLAPRPDQTVVLVCYTGHRSRWSMKAMREATPAKVVDLKGGMLAWWKRDLPVVVEPEPAQ